MVDLQQRLGIKLTHVPYKGGSDLYNGLLGSQIDAIADASGWIPLVQSGKFRLLVVWGSQAHDAVPRGAHAQGGGHRPRGQLALRRVRPQGHGPGDREEDPRRHEGRAVLDPATQAVMATYNMPTLYLDTAAYDKAARAQNQIEIDNLKRVGMLAKQ